MYPPSDWLGYMGHEICSVWCNRRHGCCGHERFNSVVDGQSRSSRFSGQLRDLANKCRRNSVPVVVENLAKPGRGFTLIELLVVLAVLGLLASLLFPALARGKRKAAQIACANQARQLAIAWSMYAHEQEDLLPYNLGATEIYQILARDERHNWANSVLNWERDAHNTNELLNTKAALGPYLAGNAQVFLCPSDRVVSDIQKQAGWSRRSRSYSMNAMVGDAGEFTRTGVNVNNPYYQQYLKFSQIHSPAETFVFIEEHPDSINDGYFLNKPRSLEWHDLPASWHNSGANLAFADGHIASRIWRSNSTRKPPRPDGADLPFAIPPGDTEDFQWLMRRTSSRDAPSTP
jgi:prepilin-type N-terminal cleavage/methylation domain-containing protein/prepilin-type processing-associated H-X9-DG protein